jgi:hypothetical protein
MGRTARRRSAARSAPPEKNIVSPVGSGTGIQISGLNVTEAVAFGPDTSCSGPGGSPGLAGREETRSSWIIALSTAKA